MATTSFLYHTLGLVGYKHLSTEYRGGAVYHHVRLRRHQRRCRHCRARWPQLRLAGSFVREFRALPVGSRRQWVVLHGHRQHCRGCGRTAREPVAFAHARARHIKAFGRFAVGLCAIAPIKSVANWLGVGWDLVKELFKADLRKRLRRRRLGALRYIAIDEFAVRKGHRYMSVVLDLESGTIVHVQEGKDAAAVLGFLRGLKRRGVKLKAVAIDMSAAYRQAVRSVFGDRVDIVHDPYHVVALVNHAIDKTRREMMRDLVDAERQALKGNRFVLLRGFERLNEKGQIRIAEMMALNQPLYELYLLKECLRRFWRMPTEAQAKDFLDAWIIVAEATDSRHFNRLAETLQEHRHGLLAYFRHPISTGPLEGVNNKIKVLKRQAYGFRDMEYFKLRLLFLNDRTYAFPG